MRRTLRTIVSLTVSALLLTSVIGAVGAAPLPRQQSGEVTYDAPVQGTITNDAFTQDWTFTAAGADRIDVRVERLDGNLVPDVTILDNNQQSVAQSYGADNTYAVAEISDFTLPQALTYTIEVGRLNADSGTTTGNYQLTVTPLGVSQDNPNNTAVVGPVQYDTPVSGEVTALHWWNVYTLDAEEGDYIQVTSQRTSGTLIPEVSLLDNNGQELSHGYASSTTDSATISGFELPYTGQYTVAALRTSGINGDTVGGFDLTVSLLGSGENSDRLTSAAPGVIDQYNSPVTGTITGAQWYQDWQFRTQAGDTVSIIVKRSPDYTTDTPNILRPALILLDSSGQELSYGYVDNTGAQAVIDRYTLASDGQYTVRVTRENYKTGVTTGGYEMTVVLDGSGDGSPFLAQSSGTITDGTPVTGTIDGTTWMNTWAFSGQKDQVITVVVNRTDGTLVPQLELRDSNGQSLTSGYAENTDDTAQIQTYSLPYAGDYQIVVSRYNGQDGYTSGGYSLSVQ
jgi:hypothetical protein